MPKCASCLWWKEKESYYFEGETQEDNIGLYLFWCKPTYFFLINLGTLSSKIKSVFFFLYYLHILLAQTGTFTPPPQTHQKKKKKQKKLFITKFSTKFKFSTLPDCSNTWLYIMHIWLLIFDYACLLRQLICVP